MSDRSIAGQRDSLIDLAGVEARWQAGAMTSSIPSPVQFEALLPAPTTLRSIVVARPFQGKHLRKWWGQHGRATKGRIRDAIMSGIAEGQGTAAIVRRVRATTAVSRRGAEMVVRTSVNHVTTHARQATYKENRSIIKGWQFIATLDSKTSLICQTLDGKTFDVDTGPLPPRHPNCRSSTIPTVKSFRELGFDLDEIPEGTRASMNGQVPGDLTYGQWLKNQPREIQVDALGKSRAALFRAGMPVEKFVDKTGRTLTIKELEALG